jgi:hypothetical protein
MLLTSSPARAHRPADAETTRATGKPQRVENVIVNCLFA